MSDSNYTITIIDCLTGEIVERDMTQEEIDALPQNPDTWPAE